MMDLDQLSIRAEKAVKLQKHLEDAFGLHPFYQELAIMATVQDSHYQGTKAGEAAAFSKIPTDRQVEVKIAEHEYKSLDEAKAFRQGVHFIINQLTDHFDEQI